MNLAEAKASVETVTSAGGEAIGVSGSITDLEMPDRLIKAAVDAYGTPDIIVNNAGFLWDGMLHNMTDKQYEEIINCHLTAPFRLVRAAAPYIRAAAKAEVEADGRAKDRAIVNVSSTSGLHGNIGQANYASAKAGITGLTKTIAREWGPLGVRANAIAFGMIDTRMTVSARPHAPTARTHARTAHHARTLSKQHRLAPSRPRRTHSQIPSRLTARRFRRGCPTTWPPCTTRIPRCSR